MLNITKSCLMQTKPYLHLVFNNNDKKMTVFTFIYKKVNCICIHVYLYVCMCVFTVLFLTKKSYFIDNYYIPVSFNEFLFCTSQLFLLLLFYTSDIIIYVVTCVWLKVKTKKIITENLNKYIYIDK